MALDFQAHYFQAFAHLPSYSRWLLDADLTSTYPYERRVLKLLQWGEPTPKPWRLKCPSHLLWLDHLDRVFPDARFVMTHRDPTDVMVSVADVYAEVGRQFSDDARPSLPRAAQRRAVVDRHAARCSRSATRGGDDRFYDIDFRAMQRDPIGEVRGLYDWLGEPVTDEFEAGMRDWWHENAEHREPSSPPRPGDVRARPRRGAPAVRRLHGTRMHDVDGG